MVSYSLRVVFLFKILLFSLQQKTCETLEKAGGGADCKKGVPDNAWGGGRIVIKRGFPTKPSKVKEEINWNILCRPKQMRSEGNESLH